MASGRAWGAPQAVDSGRCSLPSSHLPPRTVTSASGQAASRGARLRTRRLGEWCLGVRRGWGGGAGAGAVELGGPQGLSCLRSWEPRGGTAPTTQLLVRHGGGVRRAAAGQTWGGAHPGASRLCRGRRAELSLGARPGGRVWGWTRRRSAEQGLVAEVLRGQRDPQPARQESQGVPAGLGFVSESVNRGGGSPWSPGCRGRGRTVRGGVCVSVGGA